MKYIKKILTFIKSFFIKNDLIKEVEINENKLEEFLNSIEIGNIIWAKRYRNQEEKEKIPEGHREGSFIVIGKVEEGLVCLQGTGTKPKEKYLDRYLKFNNGEYFLLKDVYFYLFKFKLIDNYSYIKTLDKLSDKDINKVLKQIKKQNKLSCFIDQIDKEFKIKTQLGDIISYNNKIYLVIDISEQNNKLFCLELNKNIDNLELNYFKNYNYSKTISISKDSNFRCISSIDDNILKYILIKYKEYMEYIKNQTVTQRGSIILKQNKYYYIYSEEGQDWIAFEINKNNTPGFQKLKIKNSIYYTNFQEVKINKKETFKTISLCKKEEIDTLKDLRKHYRHQQKRKEELELTKNLRLNIGNIIEIKKYKNERFIIIRICPKTYECLSISDMVKGIYDPILIKKEDSILLKNVSIKGIKWLEWNPKFNMNQIGQKRNLDKIYKIQKEYLNDMIEQINESILSPIKEESLNAKRGCIIIKDDKYYYINGEEGQYWLVFEIFKNFNKQQIFKEKLEEIKIAKQSFYTNYSNVLKINKKDNFNTILFASESEIDIIKNMKKKYNKVKNSNSIVVKFGNIIIKDGNEYLVVEELNTMIGCIDKIDLGREDYKIHYFNVNSIDKIKLLSVAQLKELRNRLNLMFNNDFTKIKQK